MWRLVMLSLAGTLSLGALPGCARTRPHPLSPLPAPRGDGAEHEDAALPDPASAGRVSLHAILLYADRHAPEIRLARSHLASAAAERSAASPLFPAEPSLSLHVGPRMGGAGTTLDYGAAIEQPIEVAGQRGLRREVAARIGDLAQADLESARWRVHLGVHAAFHTALVAHARVAAAQRLLAFAERLMDVASKRHAAGDIPQLQLRVAAGELAMARQKQVAAAGEYRGARLSLAEAAGWPADQPPEPAGELDTPRAATATDELIALALAHHPALRTHLATVASAAARAHLADREAWPDLTLGLSLAREAEAGANRSEEHIGLVTVEIPIPLWRRNRGARARARADHSIARTEYEVTRDTIRVRVARAAAAVDFAAQRLEVYGTDIMPRFEENLTLLSRGFELGEMELLEVLVARGRFLELEREVLDTYADYFRSVAQLEAEVGTEIWPGDRHDDHAPRPSAGQPETETEELP